MHEVKVSEEKSVGKTQHEFTRRRRQVHITTDLREWIVSIRNRLNNVEYVSIGVFGIRGFIPLKLYVAFFFEIFGYFYLQSFWYPFDTKSFFCHWTYYKTHPSVFASSAFFCIRFNSPIHTSKRSVTYLNS
jgi:hypothetical protein